MTTEARLGVSHSFSIGSPNPRWPATGTAVLERPTVLTPTIETDAYEADRVDHESVKMIFLCGGIKYWWGERFGSPAHQDYVQWRNDVRSTLIDFGYLIYAPHEAFKGTWHPKGQYANDAAIQHSDLVLVVSPDYAIGSGTRSEIRIADSYAIPTAYAPPETGLVSMLKIVRANIR